MFYKYYLRFCASILYFFDEIRKDDDPGIPALLFVTVIQGTYFFGFLYSLELFMQRKIALPPFYPYLAFLFFGILNYIQAFKQEQSYKYLSLRLSLGKTIMIILIGIIFMDFSGNQAKLLN